MNLYLTEGSLVTKDKETLCVKTLENKNLLPISNISNLYVFGDVKMTQPIFESLSHHNIPIHYFNNHVKFLGSYFPLSSKFNGKIKIKQITIFNNLDQRLKYARAILKSGFLNINKVISYYIKNKKLTPFPIKECLSYLYSSKSINSLMLVEAKYRKLYYSYFDNILNIHNFKREFPNASDIINRLLNFYNSILYTEILSNIQQTSLLPEVGFIHEAGYNKYSLIYDISEIFKPIFVDRLIFKIINKFNFSYDATVFDKATLNLLFTYWNDLMNTKFFYKEKNLKITYRSLLKIQIKNLEQSILNDTEFNSYVTRW